MVVARRAGIGDLCYLVEQTCDWLSLGVELNRHVHANSRLEQVSGEGPIVRVRTGGPSSRRTNRERCVILKMCLAVFCINSDSMLAVPSPASHHLTLAGNLDR